MSILNIDRYGITKFVFSVFCMYIYNIIKKIEMGNTFELTIVEALCVLRCGYKTPQEKELYDYAEKIIQKESDMLHLKYGLFSVNRKLNALNKV